MAFRHLPDDVPNFNVPEELEAFAEEIQFAVIQHCRTLRPDEFHGILLEHASKSRWQWVMERAIGEIVNVVVQEYLATVELPKRD